MKVGIISDRPLLTHSLHRAISQRPAHRVIWIAETGLAAVAVCAADPPDVVLLVLPCAAMDGPEVIGQIMAASPCPVLIAAESLRANATVVFEAMQRGGLDAVDLPSETCGTFQERASILLEKLDLVTRRPTDPRTVSSVGRDARDRARNRREILVAIGASAGGPAAIAAILKALPEDFDASIVVVQHLDDMFVQGLATWLAGECGRPVVVAKEGDRVGLERIMVAGAAGHLVLARSGRLGYTLEPRDSSYRPSVDVFFQSVSKLWPGEVIGVLLTGMGRDGAVGLKSLRDKGHHTIAQNQESSAVFGMPKAAVALAAAVDVLPLHRIAGALVEMVSSGAPRRAL